MPSASSTLPILDAPLISLIDGRVFLDGDERDSLDDGTQTGALPLTTRDLRNRREHWSALQPGRPFPGRVVLQIDRDAPTYQVKRLVASAAAAGIYGIDFMIAQRL